MARGARWDPERRSAARARAALTLLVVTSLVVALAVLDLVTIGPTRDTASATVGIPSWWSGDCDATHWNATATAAGWKGEGAHRLGASYLGVPVCGPRPAIDGSPNVMWARPGWGEAEWQCVELAQRFMAQIYGVSAYGANGNAVVANYTTAQGGNLIKISNGTVGQPPRPGDVISFNASTNPYGHVAVVASTSIDGNGNGNITMLSQNDTIDGWRTLAVNAWVVQPFGSQTPYGWLHDLAGRGDPLAEGAFIQVSGSTAVYRVAGGAPMRIYTWSAYGGVQPLRVITTQQFATMRAYPSNGTYISDNLDKSVYRMAGGAPLLVSADEATKLPGWGVAPVIGLDHYDFLRLDHLRAYPADGTFICSISDSHCYVVAGGAPLYFPASEAATVPGWKPSAATTVSSAEFTALAHLRQTPLDGTFICDVSTTLCYETAGGAPLRISPLDAPTVPGWSTAKRVTTSAWEFINYAHLSRRPADGAFICDVTDSNCYVTAGGAPIHVPASATTTLPTWATSHVVTTSGWEFDHTDHLAALPADGTMLTSVSSGATYEVLGGVARPVAVAAVAVAAVTPSTAIDQSALDNAGLSGPWSHLASAPPVVALVAPSSPIVATRAASVSWVAPIASSAVTTYDVRFEQSHYWSGYAPWIYPLSLQGLTSTRISAPLAPGDDYCFQVRAHNRAGQIGLWSRARCVTSALDDRAATSLSSGWTKAGSPLYYGGTITRTTLKGATWTLGGVQLARVGIVATTCSTCGALGVYVNGALTATIDLQSPTTLYQQTLTVPAFTYRTGTLVLRVVSDTGKLVQLDGVALSRT